MRITGWVLPPVLLPALVCIGTLSQADLSCEIDTCGGDCGTYWYSLMSWSLCHMAGHRLCKSQMTPSPYCELTVPCSNLEDSDVSPLTPADFEGCGSNVQYEYVIHFSELCIMISHIVRERFGLRVSAERRKAALQEADEALANWSLKLPDNLRLRASDMDPWSAMLHLTYNNFLILLHRPHPRASAYSADYGPHDAEICSAAAGVIASIFEELRLNNRLKLLWYSGVHTLFTAMIQVRVELRFSNPVLAINALRRFDSASHSLRELSHYWTHAATILRLFEDSRRLQEDLRTATTERPRQFNGSQDRNTNPNPPSNPIPQPSPIQPSFDIPPTPTPDSTQLPRNTMDQQPPFYDCSKTPGVFRRTCEQPPQNDLDSSTVPRTEIPIQIHLPTLFLNPHQYSLPLISLPLLLPIRHNYHEIQWTNNHLKLNSITGFHHQPACRL